MDYDTYGSSAIELAIELANAERTDPEWARPYATDHDGELHLHYARPDAPALEQLTTTVAMGLSQVVVQHGWQRLGVCSAEGCDNVYVDTSRNASRRYCSNTCASRSTVAAYRARQKA